MSEQHADQGRRKFFKTMANMTWKQRIEHIAFYYGKFILVGAFLLYMFGDSLWEMLREKPEELFSGSTINVQISYDVHVALVDDLFVHMGGTDPEKQEVTLTANRMSDVDFNMQTSIKTQLMAYSYDYVIMDQAALDSLIYTQAFPDLNLLLPEEKLKPWSDRFAYISKDGEQYPVAINITGTPLAEGCTYSGEYIYLAFPVHIDRAPVVEPFFDYLSQELLVQTP